MMNVIGINFENSKMIYYFNPNNLELVENENVQEENMSSGMRR